MAKKQTKKDGKDRLTYSDTKGLKIVSKGKKDDKSEDKK